MKTTLMAIDGVLRKPVGGAPIPAGMRLYHGMATIGRIILLADVPASGPAQLFDWLELNGCTAHDFTDFALGQTHLYLASRLRRQGYDIDMVVEPDPGMAQELIKSGLTTMLFTHSRYAVPDWRPDAGKGVQAWDSITQQVADVARMKAADARLKDIE